MKKLLPILLAALLCFTACKPDEIIVTQTEVQRITDTLHHYSTHHDSIFLRDSIFVERSVLPAAKDSNPEARDTLRETKFVYRYLYKEKKGKDSVRVINRTDTILISKPDLRAIETAEKEIKAEHKTARRWQGRFYALIIAIIALSVFIIIRKLKS